MSEVDELRSLMTSEHASVLRSLGSIEATLVLLKEDRAEAKSDRDEFRTALKAMDDRIDGHVSRLDQYRNWMIGFGAAVTIIFTGAWSVVKYAFDSIVITR